MTVRENLEQAMSLIQQALGELAEQPPSEAPLVAWSVPAMTLAGEAGYLNEPRLLECANGDILCVYRKGTAHVSNGADLRYRRSTDRGLTWGAPVILHAVDSRDCRNHGVGATQTGRVLVFSRTTNVATTDKHWLHYSDDHGLTWATQQFFPTGSCVAFSRVVTTSKGLMRLCYLGNKIVAEFSQDNGITWGNPTYPWNAAQASATFTEPYAVAIDANRVVAVMRDDQDGGRYFWSKSADGGQTWSAGPAASLARFSAAVMVPAAPASLALRSGVVHMAWDARAPLWKGYHSTIDAEAFWLNPHNAWNSGVANTEIIHSSLIANGNATGGEYGYSDVLALSEGVLCAWYDSKTGNGTTECRVQVESL